MRFLHPRPAAVSLAGNVTSSWVEIGNPKASICRLVKRAIATAQPELGVGESLGGFFSIKDCKKIPMEEGERMNDDHMKNDDHLRQKVRQMIQAGKLPLRRADRTFGGPGAGVQCAICEETVTRDELEIELEFTRDGGLVTSRHHVHVHCFSILELERQNGRSALTAPGERQQSGAAAGANGRGLRSRKET